MILGIDPGQSGGMSAMTEDGTFLDVFAFTNQTEADIFETLEEWKDCIVEAETKIKAFIESVHSMPKQGVSSSFKFGKGFGFLIGLLVGLKIPYEFVTPQKWQKELGCMSKGDKNVTKARAQQLWPDRKWTHAISDSALIAEYGRRINK